MSTPGYDFDDDGELVAFGLPLAREPEEIDQEILDGIAERMAGWVPLPGHPVRHLAGALAAVLADERDAIQAEMRRLLLEWLGVLLRCPRLDGASASSTITVRARDLLGHVELGPITVHVGDIEMEIPTGIAIPAGADHVTVGVVCVEPGSAPNDAAGDVELSALDWLAETDPVTLDAPLSGGADPETDAAYSIRLTKRAQRQSQALIAARDFTAACLEHPAVGFAWTMRHYRPGTTPAGDDPNAVFHVSTVICTGSGGVVNPIAKAELAAEIAEGLLDNVEHHLLDPVLVPVPVTATVVRRLGWAPDDVEAAAVARLNSVLDPAVFAQPRFGDDPNPIPSRLLHRNELIARLDDVEAVDVPTNLVLGDGSSDRVVLGVRELPTPGPISVTVTDA